MPIQEIKDPRSDLKDDSRLWLAVLAVAKRHTSPKTFGLLHGLRCGGARLNWTTQKKRRLKFDTKEVEKVIPREKLQREWLAPNMPEIVKAVSLATNGITAYEELNRSLI